MARTFASSGARVVIAARSEDKIARLAKEIGSDKALAAVTDVTDEASVRALVERTVERFGRLDAAVNNAGAGHYPKPLAEISTEDFDSSYPLNLRGIFLSMRYEIPAMIESGGGAIVNVSSTAGVEGWPGLTAYAAMKHGLGGLTKVAALDYAAKSIRVNTIAPGSIATEHILQLPEEAKAQIAMAVPMGRSGTPEEVADLAAWLCSDHASYITGATVNITGGQLARIG
jgi:NAD(P)-dependent dehydrogenase (short-subunit alcohol dehydrogenase family)